MRISTEKFNELTVKANEFYREHRDWRLGQCYFNALLEIDPDLAERVRGTECDPFNSTKENKRLEHFLCWLAGAEASTVKSYPPA